MIVRRAVLAALPALSVDAALSRNALAQAIQPPQKLAIKGFDPVAYFTDGKPTPGLEAYQLSWDGQIYRFASARHRDLFKANPDKYAPQFGGSCAMNMARGVRAEADPHNWVISDGNLYVFAGPAGPDNFRKDPRANAARAAANWQAIRANSTQ